MRVTGQRPMPARPSAGPSDQSTPHGHKLLTDLTSSLRPRGVDWSPAAQAAASAEPVTRFVASTIPPPCLRVS